MVDLVKATCPSLTMIRMSFSASIDDIGRERFRQVQPKPSDSGKANRTFAMLPSNTHYFWPCLGRLGNWTNVSNWNDVS